MHQKLQLTAFLVIVFGLTPIFSQTGGEWLIVGGSRNIGYGFTEYLASKHEHHEVLVDDTDTKRARLVFQGNNYVKVVLANLCTDTEKIKHAAQGKKYIVFAPEFDYSVWEESMVSTMHNCIEAAAASGAMLIFPSRIYCFGEQKIVTENSTPAPNSQQGTVIHELEQMAEAAAKKKRCRVRIIRHSYAFGPGMEDALLSRSFRIMPQAGSFTWIYQTDIAEQFVYNIDIAHLARLLVEKNPTTYFETLNYGDHTWTSVEAFGKRIASVLQIPYQARIFGEWELTVMAMFDGNVNRGIDLKYAFTHTLKLDDTKRKITFPEFKSTPIDEAIKNTVLWYAAQRTRGLIP